MGWETRERGGLYYTESRRVKGRVVREYFGCGLVAQICAMEKQREREERELDDWEWQQERAEVDDLMRALKLLGKLATCMVTEALIAEGFHRHKGQWRRRRSAMTDRQDVERLTDEVMRVLDDAQRGREGSREPLKRLMGAQPMAEYLAKAFGDTAQEAEDLLLRYAAGMDVLCEEATRAALGDLQERLSEPNDGELERTLVRRASLSWLAVNVAERERAKRWTARQSIEVADFWDRHVSRLNADYLKACRELANVRRLRRPRRRKAA